MGAFSVDDRKKERLEKEIEEREEELERTIHVKTVIGQVCDEIADDDGVITLEDLGF